MKKCILFSLTASLLFAFTAASAIETNDMSLYPSLKQFYAEFFDFGSAISSSEQQRSALLPFYARQYAILTPENALKPENVLDIYNSQRAAEENQGYVAVQFQAVKPLLDFAADHRLKIHGHVLFWHMQTPDIFFRESYKQNKPYVTRDVMLMRMENYVRQVMEYMEANYPGLIVSWDVVNEAIDDDTGRYRTSQYTEIVGDDFVLQAFRFARKYAPQGTQLFYNDYSIPYQPKLRGVLTLLSALQTEHLVDGCGLQCHYQLTTPTISQFETALDAIIRMGLSIRISELDVLITDNSEMQLFKQSIRYQELMKALLKRAEHITAVQTWGTFDHLSWKSSSYPLLFAADGTPKPAYFALTDPDILP